jgi:hypothetical protein
VLGGCDIAKPDPPNPAGPPVQLLGIYPPNGCGVGDSVDCTVPTNVTLAFRFDRFLNPATVSRQAIRLYSGDPNVAPGPPPFEVVYDPIERVVEYRMPSGYALQPATLYELELIVADSPESSGIRAFDGAPLAEGNIPLRGVFLTGDEQVTAPDDPAPRCDEIVGNADSVFKTCTGGACHQKGGNVVGERAVGDAPHSLWLDTPSHFSLTAVNRIARQTETGDQSGGVPSEREPRFGVRMALVDPHSPGGSYLMYKLLRNLRNFEPCPAVGGPSICAMAADPAESTHALLPLAEGELITPSIDELERLREWFVLGDPMPRPRADARPLSVHLQGLRAVSRFIASGADCSE